MNLYHSKDNSSSHYCLCVFISSFPFQERNSSSLLFSSLVTRVFGVKRDKNEFSAKNNSLTSRVFFQKFPGLFTTFQVGFQSSIPPDLIVSIQILTSLSPKVELETLSRIIEESCGSLCPDEAAIYPVLVMLAKLQPAPVSTGTDEFKVGG